MDISRSEIRKRLDIYRLSDLQYFLARKKLSFPVKEKGKILDILVMKPKLANELMGVIYLRGGVLKGQLVTLAARVGVLVRRTDTREAIALKIWLRKPRELEKAHLLAKVRNVRKWKIYLKKESARFERKPLNKLKNSLRSQLRLRFRRDAVLGNLVREGGEIMVLVRHRGRGAFKSETARIRYGLTHTVV